jgi:hypothetical protein
MRNSSSNFIARIDQDRLMFQLVTSKGDWDWGFREFYKVYSSDGFRPILISDGRRVPDEFSDEIRLLIWIQIIAWSAGFKYNVTKINPYMPPLQIIHVVNLTRGHNNQTTLHFWKCVNNQVTPIACLIYNLFIFSSNSGSCKQS